MEEAQLIKGKEHETWHRRHDFWLLAGVITHGYRHWQDILSDPRFDLMNQAFKSDSERTRKAAFLNRRFQLLEQGLVIEEQLRKSTADTLTDQTVAATAAAASDAAAAAESQAESAKSTAANQRTASRIDHLQQLDELAANLKKLGQNGDPKNPKNSKMTKVLGQISTLMSDINDMSYTNMPASLAKAYVPKTTVQPRPQPIVPVGKPVFVGGPTQWHNYKAPGAVGAGAVTKPSYTQQQLPYHGSSSGSGAAFNNSKSNDKPKDVICID